MSLDKNYQGTDVNLEISLEEYGFVARPITVDYADEYFVIYKMDDNQYGSGHIRESELDAIVNGTEWASEDDVNSMLETVGASKQEWMDLPFTSKFSDLVSYWGTENIMGTDYYPNDKNWAFEEIGLESDSMDLDDLVDYVVPTHYATALINGDYSGLSDEEEQELNEFTETVIERTGNANFMLGNNDEGEYFSPANDINNLGSTVMKVYIRPSDSFAKGGSVSSSELNDLIQEINESSGAEFYLGGAYGNYELWAKDSNGGDNRIEVGSRKDIKEALIKNRYNKKYTKYAKGGGVGIDFKNFTIDEFNSFVESINAYGDIEVSVSVGNNVNKEETYTKKIESKKIKNLSLSIGDGKEISVHTGSENIYADVLVYDNKYNKGFQEYTISLFSKDDHKGLKSVVNSIIEKFAKGGGVDSEKPYQVYNYETQNIEGYFDNEMEAEEFASKFKNATVYDTRQFAKGGGVKIKSAFRLYNSPLIKFANFKDGSQINLMRLIKPYKNGEKYGISKISINKIGDEVRIFKTLEDAESYFDRIVNQKKKSVDLREEVGTTNNYGKGGVLGADARLEYVTDAFASGSLMEELKEKLGIETDSLGDNYVISFAYTDYGGDFIDKVAIAYFKENYPDNTLVENAGYNGENAYVFGEPAKEWIETTQDYPLGFEDIEDFYYEKTSEQENEDFNYFLDEIKGDYSFDKDEALQWLNENRGGYFGMTTQGLDFSFEDLTNDLVNEGVIEPNEEDEDFANGGGVGNVSYEKIYEVLKENIDESIDGLGRTYENSSDFTGEEIEHKFRDGFIPYTNGGYELSWYEYVSTLNSTGYSLPTEKLQAEMQRHVDYSYELAKDTFKETYPEIVDVVGEDNIDYNSLDEAGFTDEAQELSDWEMENMSDEDTIRCSVIAYYYEPTNDRGQDGKHTISLQGDINLEAPYHRKGKNDDFTEVIFTFDSMEELKSKLEDGLKNVIDWFNGSKPTGSDDTFAKGGGVKKKKKELYEFYDEVTDKTLLVVAYSEKEAEEKISKIDFNDFENWDNIDYKKVENINDVDLDNDYTIETYKKGKKIVKLFYDKNGSIEYIFDDKGNLLKEFSFDKDSKYIFNEEENRGYYADEDSFAKGGKAKPKAPKMVRTQFEEGEYEYAKGGGINDEFYVGQSIVLSTDDAYFKRMTKDIKRLVTPYFNTELVIEEIIKDKPYDIAKALVKENGVKVPFEIKLNKKHIHKFAKGGDVLPKYRVLFVDENGRELDEYFASLTQAKVRFNQYKKDKIETNIEKLIKEKDGDINYESTEYSYTPDDDKEFADGGGVEDYFTLKDGSKMSKVEWYKKMEDKLGFEKFAERILKDSQFGQKINTPSNELTHNRLDKKAVIGKNSVTISSYTPNYKRYLDSKTFDNLKELDDYLNKNQILANGGGVDFDKVKRADEIYREHNREIKEKGIEQFSKESATLWDEKYDNRLKKLKLTFEEKNQLNPKNWYSNGGGVDSIYSNMTEKEFLAKYFGANVYAGNPSEYFDIKKISSSNDSKVENFISELKRDGYSIKKKSFSDFTSVMGVKKKDSFANGGGVDDAELKKDYFSYTWNTKQDVWDDASEYDTYRGITEKELISFYKERIRRGYDYAVQIYEKDSGNQIYRSESFDKAIDEYYSDRDDDDNDDSDWTDRYNDDDEYAKGGGVGINKERFNLHFNYNPSNLSNEDAEKIVEQYTKDWKHDNDWDNVSFYVFNLTKEKADELKAELKMEDTFNIEIEKSRNSFSDGGEVPNEYQKYLRESHNYYSTLKDETLVELKESDVEIVTDWIKDPRDFRVRFLTIKKIPNIGFLQLVNWGKDSLKAKWGANQNDFTCYSNFTMNVKELQDYILSNEKVENINETIFMLPYDDKKVFDNYAKGGGVDDADWIEESLIDLQNETGFDDLVVENSDNNHYTASNGDAEFEVFETEDDARERAIELVKEDLEENLQYFSKDWLMNYIDGEDFFTGVYNEWNESYANDIESEDSDEYSNRLIEEMVENGIVSSEEAKEDDFDAEDYKEDFVKLMTSNQIEEGNDGLDYYVSNFGKEQAFKVVSDNYLINIDEASESAIDTDGIGHFLSRYDGEQIDLSNGHVAYRTN